VTVRSERANHFWLIAQFYRHAKNIDETCVLSYFADANFICAQPLKSFALCTALHEQTTAAVVLLPNAKKFSTGAAFTALHGMNSIKNERIAGLRFASALKAGVRCIATTTLRRVDDPHPFAG